MLKHCYNTSVSIWNVGNLLLNCRLSDLTTALAHLTKEEKADPAIRHALLIRSAWALSNYHTFFQLYLSAPNMSGYLLDLFVQRERVQALKAMLKSWVVFVLYLLGHGAINPFCVFYCLPCFVYKPKKSVGLFKEIVNSKLHIRKWKCLLMSWLPKSCPKVQIQESLLVLEFILGIFCMMYSCK